MAGGQLDSRPVRLGAHDVFQSWTLQRIQPWVGDVYELWEGLTLTITSFAHRVREIVRHACLRFSGLTPATTKTVGVYYRNDSRQIRFGKLQLVAFPPTVCSTHVEAGKGDVVGASADLRLNVSLLQVNRGLFPLL